MAALSEILAERFLDQDLVCFQASEDWGQGRTCYGGFLAVLALVSMRDVMALDTPLRALQINFIAPAPAGKVYCKVRLLRQGKYLAQVQCDLMAEDKLCGTVIGVFGVGRQVQLPMMLPQYRQPSFSPEQSQPLVYLEGVTPQFMQHIDMRWSDGRLPYSNDGQWQSRVYLKTKKEVLSSEAQIVLLSDGPPTPALSFFGVPTMNSSISWALELLPAPDDLSATDWLEAEQEVHSAADGFTTTRVKLWSSTGQLLSLGHQMIAIYG